VTTPDPSAVERLWTGHGSGARLARALLLPLEGLYRGATALRGALYDAGVLPVRSTALPALGIGNLTVGGTGKTPVAAWIAAELRRRGAHPAIVLRGYGGDEPLVHRTLNPEVPVVATPDRVRGVAEARSRGADVAVLDDAFQHRRASRVADVVLLSADRWDGGVRLLPAGPWREPLSALRRASLVLVTRKAAPHPDVERVTEAVARAAPGVPVGVVRLEPGELCAVRVDDRADEDRASQGGTAAEPASRPLDSLRGRSVLAIAAIGDPRAFLRQLEALGAHVRPAVFADHHAFTDREVAQLAREATSAELAVCTLKDAVKLGPRWSRAAPALWYVSQRVTVERGAESVERLLGAVLAARANLDTAGSPRPTDRSHGH
jgi:tetraacyldisaccharide 4'-kinase